MIKTLSSQTFFMVNFPFEVDFSRFQKTAMLVVVP